MIYKWEDNEDRVLRFMRIPPKKKLVWLGQMHELLRKALTKERRRIYFKLRESR